MVGLALSGCTLMRTPPATLVSADASAADFSARSLHDEGLRQFLARNLEREVTTPGDFETLCWVALYYHPSLALARAQWATSQAVEHTAGVRPNPTLTLTPGYNSTRELGISPWMPSVNLDFLLDTAGKRRRQQEMARFDAEASRLGVFTAAWQIRGELRRALNEVTVAFRRESLLRTQADLQRKLVGLLEQRFTLGSVASSEVSLSRSALLRAESAVADATSQASSARAHVSAALGIPLSALEGVALPAVPTAPLLSPEAIAAARRESLRGRSDIVAALAKYQAAHVALELEVAKQVPDFHLGPGYQYDQGPNKWSLAISFELPVFHRNEAPIAEAVARRAEAAAQFVLVQSQAIAAVDAAVAAQTAAAAQLERARQLRDEVKKQSSHVAERLRLGGADQVEVQTAQLDLATVETTIFDAENAATLAAGQLEDALQLPFPHLATLASAHPSELARTHE